MPDFDFDEAVWVIPAKAMKGRVGKTDPFRCPLSDEAAKVVQLASAMRRGDDLFPAQRGNGYVTDVGLSKILNKMGEAGRTHGFRSSFGTWAQETRVPPWVSDGCLQHAFGSDVYQAYHRGDGFSERREVMARWADFVTSERDAAQRANLRMVK
ncbi:MAG: hypothetical protein AAF530_25435 [Pseudomonadota bacterium]